MGKKFLISMLGLIFSLGLAFAQRAVSGTVVSAEDGQPVIGASVQVLGTKIGTVTDINGGFTLPNVQEKAVVKVSCIGMKDLEVSLVSGMQIVMEYDTEYLDAVVFTGYGTVSRTAFTGSAAKIGGDALEKKSDANFVKALEGNVTGVQMANSSNQPGTWGSVLVRGRGSINSGTQPLYIIDGVPVNSDYDRESLADSSNNPTDPMAAINPNDIESVTVLKDAAATAIYGSRAANGVIVINTKKGSKGKFNLNIDIKNGVSTIANNNMVFADAETSMNLFAQGYAARYPSNFATVQEAKDYLTEAYEWDGVSSYDWMDKISRSGLYRDFNISVSGQSGSTNYYVSGGFLNTEGVVIGSDFKRYSGRINLNSKFKIFTFGINANYAYGIKNGFSQSTSGSMSSAVVAAVSSMNPFYPFYNEDGTYFGAGEIYNPLAIYDKELGDINEQTTTTFTVSPNLQIDFGKGIYFKTTLGVNIYDIEEYQYWSAVYNPQGVDYPGLGQQFNSSNKVITWNNVLGWNYTFDNVHDINVLVGQEMQGKTYNYRYICGDNFPFVNIRELSTVGHWNDSDAYKKEARLLSFFVDAHYAYDYKYYLSASYRRDGSSVFGANNRWGDFWSLGAKWRFTNEEFLKDNTVITSGALKASYGTVGNQDIGFYASRGFYTSGYNYHGTSGMVPNSISNKDLTWEVSKKFDVGAELTFINAINVNIDVYNEVTSDALFEVPLSLTTGMRDTFRNIGKIGNRGVELSVNGNIIQNNDLVWSVYANATFNKNKVIKLAGEPITGTYTIVEEGHPYRQFYMKEYAGVDPTNGNPLFYLNEDGYDTTDDINKAAKRYLGSADPKVFGGFGTSLNWNGFDANLSFNYRYGNKVFDTGARFVGWGMSNRTPLKEMALNSWTPENPYAPYPKYVYGDPKSATASSHSRFLYNGGFLRLSNITIGYTLPKNITSKALIEKVRVYVSGDNLYTFTAKDFFGYTPDTYENGQIAWQYPGVTNFIAGIQITF